MTAPLTFTAYAKRRGVSIEAVSKAVKTGRITTVAGKKGLRMIDPDVADREWAENTDQNMQRTAPTEPPPEMTEDELEADDGDEAPILAVSKQRMEHYKAKLARLKYEEMAGKLIDAEAVKKAAFDLGRTVRESIMGIPDRIAGELAGESDPHKVHLALERELRTALEGLAS